MARADDAKTRASDADPGARDVGHPQLPKLDDKSNAIPPSNIACIVYAPNNDIVVPEIIGQQPYCYCLRDKFDALVNLYMTEGEELPSGAAAVTWVNRSTGQIGVHVTGYSGPLWGGRDEAIEPCDEGAA